MNQWFNGNGQLNASNVNEALQTISKFASIIQNNNMPSNYGLSTQSDMSDQEKDALLAKAIFTQEGKMALAQTMANPI